MDKLYAIAIYVKELKILIKSTSLFSRIFLIEG